MLNPPNWPLIIFAVISIVGIPLISVVVMVFAVFRKANKPLEPYVPLNNRAISLTEDLWIERGGGSSIILYQGKRAHSGPPQITKDPLFGITNHQGETVALIRRIGGEFQVAIK